MDSAPCCQSKRDREITHEKDRPQILGEQLNEVLKKGEAREAHRLSRFLAPSSSPSTKVGAMDCESFSALKSKASKNDRTSFLVDQNAMLQGHRDWTCLQSSVWKLRHWRATVAWSIPAELLKIPVFSERRSTKTAKATGLDTKARREGSPRMSSPNIRHTRSNICKQFALLPVFV